jgi:hypothetical protein
MALSSLVLLFNHIVLPPDLPCQGDKRDETLQKTIVQRLIHACQTLENAVDQEHAETWASVSRTLVSFNILNDGHLEKNSMVKAFESIKHEKPLVLYIVEQNAALIIRRNTR